MSATPTCPDCHHEIAREDVNVAKDVAYCRECNVAHQLSAMTRPAAEAIEIAQGADLLNPPTGCEAVDDGMGTTIIARHRQFASAAGLMFAMLFWNGITGLFVTFAIAGTVQNIFGTVPSWFPAPEMDGEVMSLGTTLFLWLFLSPFILVGLGLLSMVLLTILGRTEIRAERSGGTIFTGVGPIGWRRRFDPQSVSDIASGLTSWAVNGEHKPLLVLRMKDGAERKFASMLLPERQKFVAAAMLRALDRSGAGRQLSARR